ncbi:MAG TPA: hypothetical protein PLX18_11080 [Anaerohalosphaeraceae bacterium]|jgi:hypothetical protein|nr:hypothetical protein [Anaerohalosphaeraceae bacterium]HQI08383.1 hypothetical protein [Anaerohalosphaeraceae bacterium]
MAKRDLIRQARNLMLRSLDRVYPSGLTIRLLEQVMCTVDQNYGMDLMRKDIAYLLEKKYIEILRIDGNGTLADVRKDSMAVVKLTAAGLEITQDLRVDPSLEI